MVSVGLHFGAYTEIVTFLFFFSIFTRKLCLYGCVAAFFVFSILLFHIRGCDFSIFLY